MKNAIRYDGTSKFPTEKSEEETENTSSGAELKPLPHRVVHTVEAFSVGVLNINDFLKGFSVQQTAKDRGEKAGKLLIRLGFLCKPRPFGRGEPNSLVVLRGSQGA